MAKIIDLIKKYIKPYYLYILIAIIVLIFIYAAYYAYNIYAKPAIENDKYKDVANANRRNKEAVVYFFYADWCPHCRKAKPEWQEFKRKYDNENALVNGYRVNCKSIDCTKDVKNCNDGECMEVKALIDRYQIDSYPTVKMVDDNGETIDFDSKITNVGLEKFVDTILTE